MQKITPRSILLFLLCILLFLILAQVVGIILKYGPSSLGRSLWVKLVNFNSEQNLPTLFNTILFLINSMVLFYSWIAYHGKKSRWIWFFLSMVFLFLTVDEFCMIHESLSKPFQEKFNTSGLLYYAWVIPYGVITIIILAFFIPLWLQMEIRIKGLFVLAAVLFLTGSILLEMFEGKAYEQLGNQVDLKSDIIVTLEESLEMGGLIVFLHGLMTLIDSKFGGIRLHFSSSIK